MVHAVARVLWFGWSGVWRNLWLSLITVSTLTLTLLSVSLLVAFQVGIQQVIASAENHITLSIYFYPAVSEEQIESVALALRPLSGVRTVTYVSRGEVLARYQLRAKDTPELLAPLETIGQNPFGGSLVVRAEHPEDYARVIAELGKPQYADLIEGQRKDFEENRAFIASFKAFTEKVRFSGLIASALFALVAALVTFNAIRVAIYTHRDEIAVMKLVGATNWFVRAPFLVEVAIYSLLAVAITAGVILSVLYVVQPYLDRYFQDVGLNLYGYFQTNALFIFGAEFAFTALLNALAGSLALRRYLRV
jgi:cell division transport system permease protein